MEQWKQRVWICAVIAVWCVPAWAADYDLGNVLVSATKTELTQAEVGASATVIARRDIEQSGKTTVLEILQDVPGVSVTSIGSFGGAASVDIRGAKRGQTLVMIDGVEVYDPMGVSRDFDFAHLRLDNVERIEIVSGPQSTLYGSDAMAGVINIITRQGTATPVSGASVEAGAHGYRSAAVFTRGAVADSRFSLSASRTATDGVSKARDGADHDGYENTSLSSAVTAALTDATNVFASMHYIFADVNIDDGAYEDDPNRITDSEQVSGKIGIEQRIDERWQQTLAVSGIYFDRSDRDPADASDAAEDEFSRFRGDRKKVEWQHTLSLTEYDTEVIGYEYEREQGSSFANGAMWWSNAQSPRHSLDNRALFVQGHYNVDDRWFSTLGSRVDTHSSFGTEITSRAQTAYLFAEQALRVHTSFGTAFRAPNIYQLYDASYGNTALQPEKSRGLDCGMEKSYAENTVFFSGTYFYNRFKNLIDSDPVSWQYVNIHRGTSRGYEWQARWQACTAVLLQANYTYTKTRDDATAREFGRRPKRQAAVSAQYQPTQKSRVSLSGRYVGARLDSPAYNDYKNKKYCVADCAAQYALNDMLTLFGRVDNIFDTAYEPIRGYNGTDRAVYIGMRGEL